MRTGLLLFFTVTVLGLGSSACNEDDPSESTVSDNNGDGGKCSDESCATDPPPCDGNDLHEWSTPACEAGDLCSFATECSGGAERVFLFECEEDEGSPAWALRESDCEREAETCHSPDQTAAIGCWSDRWHVRTGECPIDQPAEGTPCDEDSDPPCGYECPSGEWTVSRCEATPENPSPNEVRFSDGTCPVP